MEKNKNNSSKGGGIVAATVATCILCPVIVGVGIYCWAKNPESFFSLSVANCLTLLIAVLLSFFYVQKQAANDRAKADLRKQKDAAIRLLEALESAIKSQSAHTLPDDGNTESLLMTKRRISNFIQTLKKNADTSDLQDCNASEYKAAFLFKLCQGQCPVLGNAPDITVINTEKRIIYLTAPCIHNSAYDTACKRLTISH